MIELICFGKHSVVSKLSEANRGLDSGTIPIGPCEVVRECLNATAPSKLCTADFTYVWLILHIDAAVPCQHSQLSESVSTDSVIVWTPGCIKQVLNITFVGNNVLIFHN